MPTQRNQNNGTRTGMSDPLGLLIGLSTTVGAAVGIVIENIGVALARGLLIGSLPGILIRIFSNK